MEINNHNPGVSGLGTTTGALTDASQSALGKDEFLKLLMSQLQNQDPMNPQKDHEFIAQLAQFSALEQQVATNERLEGVQLAQMSLSNAQMSNFIGKDIVARGDTVSVGTFDAEPVSVQLDGPAASLKITISDSAGNVVKEIEKKNMAGGTQQIAWEPTDGSGNPLPPGDYKVTVSATDSGGNPITANALVTGTVTGVSFENGFAEILIGDVRIPPGDILSVSSPGANTPPPPAGTEGTLGG